MDEFLLERELLLKSSSARDGVVSSSLTSSAKIAVLIVIGYFFCLKKDSGSNPDAVRCSLMVKQKTSENARYRH